MEFGTRELKLRQRRGGGVSSSMSCEYLFVPAHVASSDLAGYSESDLFPERCAARGRQYGPRARSGGVTSCTATEPKLNLPLSRWRWTWAFLGVLIVGCWSSPPPPQTASNSGSSDAISANGNEAAAASEAADSSSEPVPPIRRKSRLPRLGQALGDQPVTAVDRELQPGDWFEDVTIRTGVQATYRNGREAEKYFILESLGGGVA